MATVLTYLDAYCERAGDPTLWGEPLNAVTNLFFIFAAIAAALALRKRERQPVDLWLLIASLFAIGIGSGLWHLIPNGATVLMDVIPITLFIHIYLVAAMRRLLGFSWLKTGVWWGIYMGVSVVSQLVLPPGTLNGTVMYLPTYATLIILSAAVARRDKAAGRVFFTMVLIWTASLIFRTIDRDICEQFHVGTHFLWHTFNAYMLYRLLTVLIRRV